MSLKPKILEQLEFLAEIIPIPLYWIDLDGGLLGANEIELRAVGAKSIEPYLGKTVYEYYPYDMADNIMQHCKNVIKTGVASIHEDPIIDVTTGELKYFAAIRAPLRDYDGTIIGVIGTSIDITSQKEAEKLKLENQRLDFENKAQKMAIRLEEHEKFRKIADQMAHDLGSPLMALSVLTTSCAGIPETQRSMLKESASRIRDIAGSLLSQYKPPEEATFIDSSNSLFVYGILEQIVMDKQYEYQQLPIKFECECIKDQLFSFIQADSVSFKRMLSNLINNSVDAINGNTGKVTIKLENDRENVILSIIDNGKGMPESIVNKLSNNTPVTQGKVSGHGIGFGQVHEALKQNKGKLSIKSQEGVGTIITLVFPRVDTPDWMAEELLLNKYDMVLILDDDDSIHQAWDIRFSQITELYPNIKIHHFKYAKDIIDFIAIIENKENTLFLSDYELLKQGIDGLQVIEKSQIKCSVLVTSHYMDKDIRQRAYELGIRILPKVLASEIKICVK